MTNTQTLEKFIVTRDGEIDGEYYDQQYMDKRKDALKQVGREAVHSTMQVAVTVGRNIVSMLRELPEHINEY